MLSWASQFSIFCFLDNSDYSHRHHAIDCILAVGVKRSVELKGTNAFNDLQSFYDERPGWLFGHLGYELTSDNASHVDGSFNPGFFFEPEVLIQISDSGVSIEVDNSSRSPSEIFTAINSQSISSSENDPSLNIRSRLSEMDYIELIEKIKAHIRRGDCYELNFCQEFFVENAAINPLHVYSKLQEVSPNPFSAFYKINDNYCLCASPERYLQKKGLQLISQPIKGTSARSNDAQADQSNKAYLVSSQKEKSENVMIVDLVRNDLSKVCEEGSVIVEELFGIYAFPQVYQMISTIKGTLAKHVKLTEALAATFPMGSMTGAPKKKVMELIEKYEGGPRGLFSGSIGYINPEGDFDFNVVIRSIFYNSSKKYLSYWAGGGITFYSDPKAEYQECLAKVEAIKKVLA